jgi:hypothetical protein
VKLFFDEDVGRGVPDALRAVGLTNVSYVRREFRARLKRTRQPVLDEEWLPYVGKGGWLAFSCNRGILEAEAQRNLLISEGVGIVFLTTGQEKSVEVLKLILRKWDWLEAIDRNEPRPFAYVTTLRGQATRDRRVALRPLQTP